MKKKLTILLGVLLAVLAAVYFLWGRTYLTRHFTEVRVDDSALEGVGAHAGNDYFKGASAIRMISWFVFVTILQKIIPILILSSISKESLLIGSAKRTS